MLQETERFVKKKGCPVVGATVIVTACGQRHLSGQPRLVILLGTELRRAYVMACDESSTSER